MEKEITIIIPTFKPKNYINYCIDSLLKQTLNTQKYKILIVLNGEKEPYYSELMNKYKNKSIIEIIFTKEKGVSNARNLGISRAKTEYIVFIDDDDFVSKHFLKGLYEKKTNKGIVISNTLTITNERKVSYDYIGIHFKNKNKNKNKNKIFYHRKQFSTAWGKLIPKKLIENLFDIKFEIGEDALFMSNLSEKIEKINYTSSKSIYYRYIREGSASRKLQEKKIILKRKKKLILEYLKLFFKTKHKCFIITRILAQLKNN